MIVKTYYISSGRKNAMYTLRVQTVNTDVPSLNGFLPDNYICNLSTDSDKAEEKAQEYVDAIRERIGETDSFKIVFDGSADFQLYERSGRLSVQQTMDLEAIEQGIFPFGKHAGTKIVDAQDGYVLFFADKAKEQSINPVFQAMCEACLGVALDRGLIAKREQAKAERMEKDALSDFVGNIGERLDLEGEIVYTIEKEDDFGGFYSINKIRCGNDLICYIGKKLGEKGETIKFKATVKEHAVYNGIKSTKINRPALIGK